ncbi:hypothetical protein RQP46_008613 [Phenoliferia psychrophenolica]
MADNQKRDSISLVSAGYMFSFQPIFAGLVQFIVQGFLTYRASGLFHNRNQKFLFFLVMGSVIGAGLAGSLLTSVLGFMTYYGESLPIAISEFSFNTDSVLKKLGALAVRTAAYTALVALAGAIASVVIPFDNLRLTNVPCAFFLPMPSLYAFSLFTTINSRDALAATAAGMLSDSDGHATKSQGNYTGSRAPHGGLTVHVREEIAVELSEPAGWAAADRKGGHEV